MSVCAGGLVSVVIKWIDDVVWEWRRIDLEKRYGEGGSSRILDWFGGRGVGFVCYF